MESMGLLTYHLRRQYDSDICDRAARDGKAMSGMIESEKAAVYKVRADHDLEHMDHDSVADLKKYIRSLERQVCPIMKIDEHTPKDREIMVYRGQETAIASWGREFFLRSNLPDEQAEGWCIACSYNDTYCKFDLFENPTHWSEVPRLPA